MDIIPLDAAASLDVPWQSHPGFAAALRGIGRDAQALGIWDRGRLVGQLVLVRRRLVFGMIAGLATRGPIWEPETTTEQRQQALRLLRKLRLAAVESDAFDPALRLAGFRQVVTAAHVAEIDLTATPAQRLAALDPAWRNKWRKAQRSDLAVRILPFKGDPQHWLLRKEAEQRRARRYHTLSTDLTAAYAKANPGMAILFQADHDGAPVAAMLMLLHGRVATYQIGWTGPKGRDAAAHQLLLMTAADWLYARGFVRLDLGTVDTETNPGLASFKIGSGARIRALGGSWLALPWF